MNMFEALTLSSKIEPELCQQGLYHMGAYDLSALGIEGNIEQRLTIEEKIPNKFPMKEEILLERVQRYITRKFNYLAMV